jgi:hypothetical protein
MGDPGFEVDIGQLRQHAKEVGGLDSTVDRVVDAGKQVTPGGWDNAYGLICQQFPQQTRPLAELQIDHFRAIAGLLQHAAENLTHSADTYDDIDNRILKAMQDLMDKLGTDPPAKDPNSGDTTQPAGPNWSDKEVPR